MTNNYQFGWESMAEYVGCCSKTLKRKKLVLINAGVIDYQLKGSPPKRVMRWKTDLYDEFKKNNIKS
jgi:hypothetical protein